MSSNKEDNFGNEELNNQFKELDEKTKNNILVYTKDIQIKILNDINNPELKILYDNLSNTSKEKYDSMKIREKYNMLNMLLKIKKDKSKKEEEEKGEKEEEKGEKEEEKVEKEKGEKEKDLHPKKNINLNDLSGYFVKPNNIPKNAPDELFINKEDELTRISKINDKQKLTPSQEMDNLVNLYYKEGLYNNITKAGQGRIEHELEVRFGTKYIKGINTLTKNDYDNVVKVLKSLGFVTTVPSGVSMLRIQSEFIDSNVGETRISELRVEIDGINMVQQYCKTDDIKNTGAKFKFKRKYKNNEGELVYPVDVNDFNFRVSLQKEEFAKKGTENYVIENWRKSKKQFRFLNRVPFYHPNYPLRVDLSITKTGNSEEYNGRNRIKPVFTIKESNVFNNPEKYEIEIEVLNKTILESTLNIKDNNFNTSKKLLVALRKVIKFVLSGFQGTMYPISYPEKNEVMKDYMKMIWREEYSPYKMDIKSKYFIGPNSITLQRQNIAIIDVDSTIVNIRKNFVVTDKADGDRHLMYVSNIGKIYLISTNMELKFTGAKTLNKDCFNTLFDGELISYNKNGDLINLYAAFDIYYHNNIDIRHYPFMLEPGVEEIHSCRYYVLSTLKLMLNPISILNNDTEKPKTSSLADMLSKFAKTKVELSPIKFNIKKFYPMSPKETIFQGCKTILEQNEQNLFEYNTDGLIFTHAFYGVGSNEINKSGPKTKITWEYSFKWKPPKHNTIDFLVTTLKTPNGEDVVNSLFEEGISSSSVVQSKNYKTIELRCGFNMQTDIYLNPCQSIIDDIIPEPIKRFDDKKNENYLPKRFCPTEPYNPNAGLCNIMLKNNFLGLSDNMIANDGEVFNDNTIVEFSYDLNAKEGWEWIPLRVRYDKTAKLRKGEKEFGNSYKVCNENWKSIQPSGEITEIMLMTGNGIPETNVNEDIYYNATSGENKTEALRNFHNLYVKKILINGVSKRGNTLIDFACGKAGDLPKWISAKLSFVFGLDYSKDNIENLMNGACVRYIKSKQQNKHIPDVLFAHCNSSFNIRDGSALLNDKAKQISNAVFGNIKKETANLGKGVVKQYGKGEHGFNVSSCQFAIHYFFENPDTLKGFLKNVAECTKLEGYFIGTAYDGKELFKRLKKLIQGDSIQLEYNGKKIWEVVKNYAFDTFEDDSSCIGYKINVFQESINRPIYEYLVNFDYLNRLMENYGFKLINSEESKEMGLPEGSGLFRQLFNNMTADIKENPFKKNLFGQAPNMNELEQEISFLNRYFIYKKVRDVNVDELNISLSEYDDSLLQREQDDSLLQREQDDTIEAIHIAKTEKLKLKQKVKKLSKKILLIPATEAVDEPLPPPLIEIIKETEKEVIKKPRKKTIVKKPKIIIEEDVI